MNDYPIPIEDFSLIYRVIHSVLSNEKTNFLKACRYFNTIGSQILQKQYKINAKPVGGLAIFQLSESAPRLTLGTLNEKNQFISTQDAFHFWIKTDEYYIDFTSPLYGEVSKAAGSSIVMPSKMFQRKRSDMRNTPDDVKHVGDFYFEENQAVTEYYTEKFNSHPMNQDLIEIANSWYNKPPGETKRQFNIENQRREETKVKLSYASIREVW
jgi:hypothetical protein